MVMRDLWDRLVRPSPEQVVRRCAAQVQSDLRRIFGPGADLDDLTQTVFVEVLRALESFEGRSPLEAWVRRITWNVAYQEMRLGYRRQRWESPEEVEAVAPAHEAPDERLLVSRLYRALDALSPKQRLVVVLHDVEGQTLKEIGLALGRPLQTVASQLHAGRKALGQALGATRGDGKAPPAGDQRRER